MLGGGHRGRRLEAIATSSKKQEFLFLGAGHHLWSGPRKGLATGVLPGEGASWFLWLKVRTGACPKELVSVGRGQVSRSESPSFKGLVCASTTETVVYG